MPAFVYDVGDLIGRRQPEPERPAPQPKHRKCLRCRDPFTSTGPGHRLCDQCRAAPTAPGAFDDPRGHGADDV